MRCLYTKCNSSFARQDAVNARPYHSTYHGAILQDARGFAPAVMLNRSVLQQRSFIGVPRLRPARSAICRAATPQSTKLDSSMIWGDIMMLTATELASERLPKQLTGVLSLTLLAAWIGVSMLMLLISVHKPIAQLTLLLPQVAAAKGDYTVKRRHTLSYEYAYGISLGMQQAAITWVSP